MLTDPPCAVPAWRGYCPGGWFLSRMNVSGRLRAVYTVGLSGRRCWLVTPKPQAYNRPLPANCPARRSLRRTLRGAPPRAIF